MGHWWKDHSIQMDFQHSVLMKQHKHRKVNQNLNCHCLWTQLSWGCEELLIHQQRKLKKKILIMWRFGKIYFYFFLNVFVIIVIEEFMWFILMMTQVIKTLFKDNWFFFLKMTDCQFFFIFLTKITFPIRNLKLFWFNFINNCIYQRQWRRKLIKSTSWLFSTILNNFSLDHMIFPVLQSDTLVQFHSFHKLISRDCTTNIRKKN